VIIYFIKNKIKGVYKPQNKGFFVLTMTLLVLVTVLTIATGILLRSIGELKQTQDSENALKAWSTVNACGEYALGQLATTEGGLPGWDYAGGEPGPLLSDGNSCYIYPVVASGTSKIIMASSTVSEFTRKVLIEVATNTPKLVVNSWRYVADF